MKQLGVSFALATVGCSGVQSAGENAGAQAAATTHLFGLFMAVTGVFYFAVLAFLAIALLRGRTGQQGLQRAMTIWAGLIVVGLFGLTLASYATDRSLANLSSDDNPLRIRVTAQQWWWQIEYLDAQPSRQFKTANELRLPLDSATHIEMVSEDVIHSLWLPSLAGKQDLIPGRQTDLDITPRKLGRFRGQCAEFCGAQHTRMALDAYVVTQQEFDAWRRHSLEPARQPADEQRRRGQDYFMKGPCSTCHTISGTPARGVVGPDLTHVASRATLAGGTLPNTLGYLEGWISNPQALKPGARMPDIDIAPTDLHAVAAYLQGLT